MRPAAGPLAAIVLAVAACAGSAPSGRARVREQPAEQPVATTARFVFWSRFDWNLSDRLLRWARGEPTSPEDTSCVAELGAAERGRWERAVAAFRPLAADDPGRAGLRVRYELIYPGDARFDESLGPVPSFFRAALRDAAPTYRRCWWRDDDRRNRAWVEALVPRLRRVEERIATQIAAAHASEWPTRPWTVDVVPVVNFGGGNTVVHPDHTLISSTGAGFESFGGIEMVFHEVSHTIVSPRSGGSIEALRRAAERASVPLPDELWHAVLFFTAGELTARAIREEWAVDYVPYMITQGLYDRAWPTWRAPLEAEWRPYLEGRRSLDDAARSLVAAVAAATPAPP